jgi:hypothetical protein
MSSIMVAVMIVEVLIFILNYDLLEDLMRIVSAWLRLMTLFCDTLFGGSLSNLRELSLHLRISHSNAIQVDSVRVLIFKSS